MSDSIARRLGTISNRIGAKKKKKNTAIAWTAVF